MSEQVVMDGPPLLEAEAVAKSYGAVKALRRATVKVHAGEVVALAGDNGAGKSTLIKVLGGIVQPDGGELRFAGEPVSLRGPDDATSLGIQTVYQDLALCDNLDVVENVYLGCEVRRPPWLGWRMSRPRMERRAREALESLGVNLRRLDVPVTALSGGQRQSTAVCRAILGDPKVVILDEPTAALGVTQTREVIELIGRLKHQGRGVLIIAHDLQMLLEIADRIVVLRLGETVADRPCAKWTEHALVTALTGGTVTAEEEL